MTSAANTPEISPETSAQLARPLWGHVIDGEVVPSLDGATMPVIDPATGKEIGTAAQGSEADVRRAVESARAAFDDGRWRRMPPMEKERCLHRMAALLAERGRLFSELDILDAGMLHLHAVGTVDFTVDLIDYYAGWPSKLSGTVPAVPDQFAAYELREPVGVIAIIAPWNAPTAIFAFIASALAAGNCVVYKPAEQTPIAAVLMAELAVEAGIPAGVFNVVQGLGKAVGEPLVTAPEVDSISFTGSVATGSAIQALAAQRVKRTTLELGGKSPHIIFPDADLDAAIPTAMRVVWMGSGQTCVAGTRVLIHRDIHDEVVDRIVEGTRKLKIGPGLDPESQLGPLVSAQQLERVQSYVEIGREEGAELAYGGGRHGDVGFFHEPTIFTGVRSEMRIAQEEIFGPVMSILSFDSEEEAYRLANDSVYALAAGVWTRDISRAHRAMRALQAGVVWVNCYRMAYPSVPLGGFKHSGYGKQNGAAALDDVTQLKSVLIKVA